MAPFTLIELLVVVAIIGILMTILLPALSNAKFTAKRVACTNNMKQLGYGMFTYSNDNDGYLARNDYGRVPWGSWAYLPGTMGIATDAANKPKGIVGLAAWMIGTSLTPDLYFCPGGKEYGNPASTTGISWAKLQKKWQTASAKTYFRTGGAEGDAHRNGNGYGCVAGQYYLNGALYNIPSNKVINIMDGTKRVKRALQLKSYHPVLVDFRASAQGWKLQPHLGKGLNCMTGDGATHWLTTAQIVRNGLAAYSKGYTDGCTGKWTNYNGVSRFPEPPFAGGFDTADSRNSPFGAPGGGWHQNGVLYSFYYYLKH